MRRAMKDARYWWLLLVAALALGLHVWLTPYVSPTAALRLRVQREEAPRLAAQFLAKEKVRIPAGYRTVTTFGTDSESKNYLEQTLGLQLANRVAQQEGFVYAWQVRLFRPGTQEEFYLSIDPDGRVIGFEHVLPSDQQAAESPHPEAAARAFLQRVCGVDVSAYELKNHSVVPHANRKDYRYTWERKQFKLGEATQRIAVIITGNQVIAYQRGLHIPDAFKLSFEKEDEKGNLLANVAFGFFTIFTIAGLVALVLGMARRTLNWRVAVLPAALVALVGLLNDVNLLPLQYTQFDVTDTDFAFWSKQALSIVQSLFYNFFSTCALVIAAEWLYRKAFPTHTPLSQWFTRRGIASTEGRKRVGVGYTLLCVHLAFAGLFYFLVERYLHGWSPAEVHYDDLFSTTAPWAFALLVGVQAAVAEEFLFRVLAISWLKRFLKHDWLAILIPAMVWAFAHCNYPNKPFYIRGIELTIIGVLFGLVFVRFGPLPTLISHAAFNAMLTAESFLGSVLWQTRISFLVVLLVVLVPVALAVVRPARCRQEEAEAATNEELTAATEEGADEQPAPTPVPAEDPPYRTMRPAGWVAGITGLLLCVLTIVAFLVMFYFDDKDGVAPGGGWRGASNPAPFWQAHYADRKEAVEKAMAALQRENAVVDGWVLSAIGEGGFGDNGEDYLTEYLSDDEADELVKRMAMPQFLWTVRWQKPLSRESWVVRLRTDGTIWDVVHTLPEDAGGIALTEELARQQSKKALSLAGIDLMHYRLTGSDAHAYPNRTAYTFTWEPKGLTVGKAQFLTRVRVEDGRVNGIERSIEPPDSFRFAHATERPMQTVATIIGALLMFGLLIWVGSVYVTTMLRYTMPWGWGIGAGIVCSVLLLAIAALLAPLYWAGLPTTIAPSLYLVGVIVAVFFGALMQGAVLGVSFPPAVALWHQYFPDQPGPRFWWRAFWQPFRYRAVWREAIINHYAILGTAGVIAFVSALIDRLSSGRSGVGEASIPPWVMQIQDVQEPTLLWFPLVNSYYPPLFLLVIMITLAALVLLGWLCMVTFGRHMFRHPLRAIGALVLLMGLPSVLTAGSAESALRNIGMLLVVLLAAWMLYRLVVRHNPLVLPLCIISFFCASSIVCFGEFHAYRLLAVFIPLAGVALYSWALISAIVAAGARPDLDAIRMNPDIPPPPDQISDEALAKYRTLQLSRPRLDQLAVDPEAEPEQLEPSSTPLLLSDDALVKYRAMQVSKPRLDEMEDGPEQAPSAEEKKADEGPVPEHLSW
ncbi:MAG: CPBP family intramembrane glutamic endopeptidase [Armatimonadota bacterium]